jgi:hypothetical protein
MALDPTAREANIRDSIKKYFVDSMHPQYHLMFDKGLRTPNVQGTPSGVDRWISVNFGSMDRGDLSEHFLTIFCCTRKDNEGFKLAQLSDTVLGYLSDDVATHGMKQIDFYRSYQDQAWSKIGGILVQEVLESQQFQADDETKFKILTARLRWSSKI